MLNTAAVRAPAAPCSSPAKMPRETFWRLDVECRSCTEALPRLFGLLAQHGLIPATIDYHKGADGFAITMTIAPADSRIASLLTGRIERIVTVARVAIQQCNPL